jgi:hypothetical protein
VNTPSAADRWMLVVVSADIRFPTDARLLTADIDKLIDERVNAVMCSVIRRVGMT